ncbi:MAG: hypothetical protein IPN19_05120 [Elusimicrobia bacterium]|nr:hypothetical protein [Elusimicrobiota bacterium]
MMEFLSQYVELMGDLEFALYTGIFVFSVILLFGLIGKLLGMKGEAVPAVREKNLNPATAPGKSIDVKGPSVAETFLATAEKKNAPVPVAEVKPADADGKKEGGSIPEKAAASGTKDIGVSPIAGTAAADRLEGAMMWDGDSGKKKKGKNPPPPPAAPVRVLPPGYVDPKTSVAKEKESEKTVVLVPGSTDSVAVKGQAEKSPPAADSALSTAAAVPPSTGAGPASAGTVSASAQPEKPPAATNLKTESTTVSKTPVAEGSGDGVDAKPGVDFHMYETLVRRIAGLESELKKDPLYLDPLMRRVSVSERKLEELNEKLKAPAIKNVTVEAAAVPAGVESEVKVLREKVDRLQKLLEQLAEGPADGVAS